MPNVIGNLLFQNLKKFQNELLKAVLITFDINKIRIRILPLK
jgi:hypothetical protein